MTNDDVANQTAAAPAIGLDELNALKDVTDQLDLQVEVRRQDDSTESIDSETEVEQSNWFAATPTAPSSRRYQFTLQMQEGGHFVLYQLVDGAGATRLPSATGWQRALVTGTVHVLASDRPLTRPQIASLIGGHSPPPDTAKPPAT